MPLETQLEALLFYRGEPVAYEALERLLGVNRATLLEGLEKLSASLAGRGVSLIRTGESASLATASEASELIERMRREELSKELSRASAETLAVVLYHGPLTRSDIDFIRGVNSTFILRNLLVRGLIEKTPHPEDQRAFLYRPTAELLAHLGITRIEELPEFDKVKREIESFKTESVSKETPESAS